MDLDGMPSDGVQNASSDQGERPYPKNVLHCHFVVISHCVCDLRLQEVRPQFTKILFKEGQGFGYLLSLFDRDIRKRGLQAVIDFPLVIVQLVVDLVSILFNAKYGPAVDSEQAP